VEPSYLIEESEKDMNTDLITFAIASFVVVNLMVCFYCVGYMAINDWSRNRKKKED
jgi:hypothetical protein